MALPHQTSEQEHIDAAMQFAPPDIWPSDATESQTLLLQFSKALGVWVGVGVMSVDLAYERLRLVCEVAEVSTAGRIGWRAAMGGTTWWIDHWAQRSAEHFAQADNRARSALRKLAGGLIGAGQSDRQVRDGLADAAAAMLPMPPVEILGEAYSEAVSDARRNARWMMTRGTA